MVYLKSAINLMRMDVICSLINNEINAGVLWPSARR